MTAALSGLWTGTIPTMPLVIAGAHFLFVGALALLVLSSAALWLGRERTTDTMPQALHFGDEERLAA